MYFVANKFTAGYKYYWFQLNSSLDMARDSIKAYQVAAGFNYNKVGYLSQPGGDAADRIKLVDCGVSSGFIQDRKLHFVYTKRNGAGDAEIIYVVLNTRDNSKHNTIIPSSVPKHNYAYPSIASYSANEKDIKTIIVFLSVGGGSGRYVSMQFAAVDSTTIILPTILKAGVGIVDFDPSSDGVNSFERCGDYSCAQRKYNAVTAATATVWAVGSYAFGLDTNRWGQINDYNAYITELMGSTLPIQEVKLIYKALVYPNPVTNATFALSIPVQDEGEYTIYDINGKKVESGQYAPEINIYLKENYSEGYYYLDLQSKKSYQYEPVKLYMP